MLEKERLEEEEKESRRERVSVEDVKKDKPKLAITGSIRGTLSPLVPTSRSAGGSEPIIASIETYQELLKNRVVGETPDGELLCNPRWLLFNSPNGYKKPCYGDFTITNKDSFTVAWCIKTKEKMMRLSQSHGILKAGEHIDLTVTYT
ncbi:unnamed protein product [Strongylus vulgaris]|uniref:MSP domain-containing protein n=1 Tax=Strongylus vulgaris TaxID=40348 RepID=A0A3P7I5G5_STRVU|nr:unnamed protein product [Strongylus vulgaris]